MSSLPKSTAEKLAPKKPAASTSLAIVSDTAQAFVEATLKMKHGDSDESLEDERPLRVGNIVWAFEELEDAVSNLRNDEGDVARYINNSGAPVALAAVLKVEATSRDTITTLGSLIAAFPNAGNKADLDAYGAVLIENLPDSLSLLVLRLAVKSLIRHSRFLPAVGEILAAIENAERRVWHVPWRLKEIAGLATIEGLVGVAYAALAGAGVTVDDAADADRPMTR